MAGSDQLTALGYVVGAGLLWAVEVVAWRAAGSRGMSNIQMTAWTGVMMGIGGVLLLGYDGMSAKPAMVHLPEVEAAPTVVDAMKVADSSGQRRRLPDGEARAQVQDTGLGWREKKELSATDVTAVALCMLAGVAWLAACFCFNVGMQGLPSSGIANGIAVVVQTVGILGGAWVLFGERIADLKSISGIVLMLLGMVVVNLK
eukprot:TRINITY_DN7145_c0_g1_i1.p1 TRINITY_DN7145_c0_g1~~TRINITY_DN7145_c0_g1_i1.p1  ORF type:complete len:221 (+),score=69.87 TRINITY_DN7145_c0_g1_i1:58-663(+)